MNIEQKTDLLNKLLKLSLQQFSILNKKYEFNNIYDNLFNLGLLMNYII